MASSKTVLAEVKTFDRPSSESAEQQFCNMCLVERSKYTCPRCNIRYCSVTCYKSESHLQCSEQFYKECIMEEVRGAERSTEDKQRMMQLLQKFESENAPPLLGVESDTPTLEERLAGLDIDEAGDEVWQRLTAEERRQFQEMIKSGTVADLLDTYTPWWKTSPGISEVGPSAQCSSLPALPTDLPPLSTLVKTSTVSPSVQYTVVNVLFAYAYVVRLFNGDHKDLSLQASETVLELGSSLREGVVFNDVHEAVRSPLTLAQQNHSLFNSHTFSLFVLKDVLCILGDRRSHDSHVTRALADLHEVLRLAHKQIKGSKGGGSDSKTLWQAKKKTYFLLVWASEHHELMPALGKAVDLEIGMLEREQTTTESKSVTSCDSHVSTGEHNKKLIQEIS